MKPKLKISITLNSEMVDYVDQLVDKEQFENRSQCIEKILQSWSRQHQASLLREEIAHYYRTRTAEEKEEDDSWNRLAEETIKEW